MIILGSTFFISSAVCSAFNSVIGCPGGTVDDTGTSGATGPASTGGISVSVAMLSGATGAASATVLAISGAAVAGIVPPSIPVAIASAVASGATPAVVNASGVNAPASARPNKLGSAMPTANNAAAPTAPQLTSPNGL